MKRYIRSTETEVPNLFDLINKIDFIVICDDVFRQPSTVSAADELEDGEELTSEQNMITWTDKQLSELSEEEIHQFTNIELLYRLARIDKDKLSAAQLKLLQDPGSRITFKLSEEDKKKLIDSLKQCKNISYDGRHRKTNKFALDSEHNLRVQDCIDIIHHLKYTDYIYNTYSSNGQYLGDNLVVLQPNVTWRANNGMVFHNLTLYIKLDIDLTDDVTVALISFHDAKEDEKD